MKQVLVASDGAFCAQTPAPSVAAGEVLVAVHYSLISAGTETGAITVRPKSPEQEREEAEARAQAEREADEAARALDATTDTGAGEPEAPLGLLAQVKRSIPGPAKSAIRLGLKAVRNPRKALVVGRAMVRSGGVVQAVKDVQAAVVEHDGQLPSEALAAAAPVPHRQGLATGYAAAGVVIALGEGVSAYRVGDRVACAGAGVANHAEVIAAPVNLCAPVPEGLSLREACSMTLGAIAMQGVRRADLRMGESCAVIGLGLLGLLAAQMLRASGVDVLAFDPDAARVAAAARLGFRSVTSDRAAFDRMAAEATGAMGVDATMICAGAKTDAICQHAMELTRRKGRVVVVGDVGLGLKRAPFYAKEIDFLISCSYGPGRYDASYEREGRDYPYAYVRWTENRNMRLYLRQVADGSVDFSSLIDAEHAVDDAAAAYLTLVTPGVAKPIATVLRYPAAERDDAPVVAGGEPSASRVATEVATGLSSSRVQLAEPRPAGAARRMALVGAGAFNLSMLHPRFAARPDAFAWQAIVSRRGADARNHAIGLGIPLLFGSLEDAIASGEIDGVCIGTRHAAHAGQIAAALDAGLTVFCEKPAAISWEQLETVRRAVQAREASAGPAPLMVGFNRRFAPGVRAIVEALADAAEPKAIVYRMNAGALPANHWTRGAEGGGRNLGEACHIYDLFGAITGSTPVSITACAIGGGGDLLQANENFSASVAFADGSIATLLYTARGEKASGKERMEVFCGGRTAVLDDYLRASVWQNGLEREVWRADAADKGHAEQIGRFADYVSGGAGLPVSYREIEQATAIALWVEELLAGGDGARGVTIDAGL